MPRTCYSARKFFVRYPSLPGMSRIHSTLIALVVSAAATGRPVRRPFAPCSSARRPQRRPSPRTDLASRQAKLAAWSRSLARGARQASARASEAPALRARSVPRRRLRAASVGDRAAARHVRPAADGREVRARARPRRPRRPRPARATTTRVTTTAATAVTTRRRRATEMRSHALRLYVFSITLLVFFVLWAVIAARPWAAARSVANPALKALARSRAAPPARSARRGENRPPEVGRIPAAAPRARGADPGARAASRGAAGGGEAPPR